MREPLFLSQPTGSFDSTHSAAAIVGGAPLPVEVLRWLGRVAGISFWSDHPDIVVGTRETAALIATERGERVLSLPAAMTSVTGGKRGKVHVLDLNYGEGRLPTAG